MMERNMLSQRLLERVILGLLIILFLVSVFGMSAKGLLWNDEALTAMFGRRVLEYGVPLVDDGKNVLNATEFSLDKNRCVKEGDNVYICTPWMQYYIASIGVYIGSYFTGIYLKTAVIRTVFGLTGVVGVFLMGVAVAKFVDDDDKDMFWMLFVVFELLSVYFALFTTQVRHYSPTLLLVGAAILFYTRYKIAGRGRFWYFTALPIALVLLYLNFYPALLIFVLAAVIFEFIGLLIGDRKIIGFVQRALPFIVAGVIIAPLVSYFETLQIIKEKEIFYSSNIYSAGSKIGEYLGRLFYVLEFLFYQEFLFVMILAVGLIVYATYRSGVRRTFQDDYLFKTILFLFVLWVVYALVISRIPNLFNRYFLLLQPLTGLIIVSGYLWLSRANKSRDEKKALGIVFMSMVFFSIMFKMPGLYKHVYELCHEYRGPLDYAIPYIQSRFGDGGEIVIATNYEEATFMYYLNSKVVVGYIGNNIEEDRELQPDIIIPRYMRPNNREVLDEMLERAEYEEVIFEVYDYQYNNIPELTLVYPHLFKTKLAERDEEKLRMYVKTE